MPLIFDQAMKRLIRRVFDLEPSSNNGISTETQESISIEKSVYCPTRLMNKQNSKLTSQTNKSPVTHSGGN